MVCTASAQSQGLDRHTPRKGPRQPLDAEKAVWVWGAVVAEARDVVPDDEEVTSGDQSICRRCQHLAKCLDAWVEVRHYDEIVGGTCRPPPENVLMDGLDVNPRFFGALFSLGESDA